MPLNCHTYYSLCYGTLSTENLLNAAKSNGYEKIILADINNTSAVLDAARLSKEMGIEVGIGIDFRNGAEQQYVGIAKNNNGFRLLNIHLSEHLHKSISFLKQAPLTEDVFIIYPLKNYDGWALMEHEFIGISSQELLQLPLHQYKKMCNKMAVLQTVSFLDKKGFNAHRLLRAIDKNVLLSKLDKKEEAPLSNMLIPYQTLLDSFKNYPEIIANTNYILENTAFEIVFGKNSNKNKLFFTQSLREDIALLRQKTYSGIAYRYETQTPELINRIEKELGIIAQMNFTAYFLINWDLVNYAQSQNYFYVGRGSGANSIVAYLLRITDVDPIELDLYFERFINPYRTNPPDFDMDFSWTDRDDITHYIFEKYGYEHTALLGSYTTFQHDAVIRQLGKVFGLPIAEIEKLQHVKSPEELDSTALLVMQYSQLIAGFPSHLSIHASGILISEAPIANYSATFLPPKGYPTTQFSMIEAEDIGLAKFDILSQRGLGKIKDAVEIIKENRGVSIDIHQIKQFKEDKKVKYLLSIGKCIGCFYIESPAMRMLLSKLKADDYLRLVAASSIIRPGVSKSGMMSEYILRFRDESRRQKAKAELPELYEILSETYGIMVYQEDVIKVGHYFAGLSLADSDYLRRGMSWKFKQRNEFEKVKANFFSNCETKGIAYDKVLGIWTQIESFANYAFSKAHSASYAVESFQALYLKAYFPLEYLVGTLNNGGGFYRTEFYVHEAKMNGATVKAPCINNSDVICCIKKTTIYLGFQLINELERNTIICLLNERQTNGLFADMPNFINRTATSLEQTILLIRVGAFSMFNPNKKELLWQAHLLINKKKESPKNQLFEKKAHTFNLPKLNNTWLHDAFDEIELLGFALCNPFKLIKESFPFNERAKNLKHQIGKKTGIVAYLCTAKRTQTAKGERMYFGTFIDQNGEWLDTVHFPKSLINSPFKGPGCYAIEGKVIEEFDFIYIQVETMRRLTSFNRDD